MTVSVNQHHFYVINQKIISKNYAKIFSLNVKRINNQINNQIYNPNPLINTENNLIATLTMSEMRPNTLQLFFFPIAGIPHQILNQMNKIIIYKALESFDHLIFLFAFSICFLKYYINSFKDT